MHSGVSQKAVTSDELCQVEAGFICKISSSTALLHLVMALVQQWSNQPSLCIISLNPRGGNVR